MQDILIEISYICANVNSLRHVHPCLYNDPVATERIQITLEAVCTGNCEAY